MPVTTRFVHSAGVTKKLRQALVLLHLMTAFGWFAATVAVLLLTAHGQVEAALLVDDRLLADCSFMTVYTGLMLAANWGFTRFWWITVKLVTTIGLALGGRALFHDGMFVAGGVLMVAAIAALAWIGRMKPWGQLRPHVQAKPWRHPAIYVVILATPVLDYVTGLPLQAIPAAAVLVLASRTARWPGRGVLSRPGGRR
ncbi:hypothetical protein SAMN05661093_06358 [Kibdelosporangium aridum]|uniref:DUF2269 domain-containing protein n=1 Tax=Kibdelosporangium aridum TaxID=2030 RepID=A0A1Y5XYU9_KIBAR|nr:hypothetical protein SAMN05661093_06358 [Kibdelosporangium aridum]